MRFFFLDLVIFDDDLKQLCLLEIDKLLCLNGKSLEDFDCMLRIESSDVEPFNNILLGNELVYNAPEMLSGHNELFVNLNEDQLVAYQCIIDAVGKNLGGMFFVDGYGGTGKTYLWNTLSFCLRSEGKIVLNVASSGIASLLLPPMAGLPIPSLQFRWFWLRNRVVGLIEKAKRQSCWL